jgi:hypothetical protein
MRREMLDRTYPITARTATNRSWITLMASVRKEAAKMSVNRAQTEALEECKRILREIAGYGKSLELIGSKSGKRAMNRLIAKLEKEAQRLCDKYRLGRCVYCHQLEVINLPPICDECSSPEAEWTESFTTEG